VYQRTDQTWCVTFSIAIEDRPRCGGRSVLAAFEAAETDPCRDGGAPFLKEFDRER
jgi:hypothetical protein